MRPSWIMTPLAVAFALPSLACAALGGDAASIAADQDSMKGTVVAATAAAYTRYEIRVASGTLLTEHLSPQGRVFAVTWRGPTLPDLRQLLGPYFARYVNAPDPYGAGTGPRVISEPGLVVHAAGHMRGFVGRAVLTESLPEGVRLEDLR